MQQRVSGLHWITEKRRPSAFIAAHRSKSYPGVPNGDRSKKYPEPTIKRIVLDADRTGIEIEYPGGSRYELLNTGQMIRRS